LGAKRETSGKGGGKLVKKGLRVNKDNQKRRFMGEEGGNTMQGGEGLMRKKGQGHRKSGLIEQRKRKMNQEEAPGEGKKKRKNGEKRRLKRI